MDQIDSILARFEALAGSWGAAPSLSRMRVDLDGFFQFYPVLPQTQVVPGQGGLLVTAHHASGARVVMVLHGGGFSTGSAAGHVPFASRLSEAAAAACLVVDYRLAPENIYPAALEDCLAAYRCLIAEHGIAPGRIALCGDSAGGGLALAMMLRLRTAGEPLPSCAALLSAWADLACRGASYHENAVCDPIATQAMALSMAETYLAGADPEQADASPLRADLSGLPPVLLHVSDTEIFLDDSRTIAHQIEQTGGQAILRVWPGMIHQWHLHAGALDESAAAIAEVGAFLRAHMER